MIAKTSTDIDGQTGKPVMTSMVHVIPKRGFFAQEPALEIEGHHVGGDAIEPHIGELTDREAAGAAPHALLALLHHAKTKHGMKRIQIPNHTPQAANIMRKLLPLAGKVYQGQQISNPYKGQDEWVEAVANAPHLMSGFNLTLSEKDPE